MPAKKPSTLNVKNDTKADRADRASAESAMTPKTELTLKPPISLNGHKIATATWKRQLKLWYEVDGIIATAFDENVFSNYCLVTEDLVWLEKKRNGIEAKTIALDKQINLLLKKKLTDDERKLLGILLQQYSALETLVKGLDARLDGKYKLHHTLSQSLYLTPRARAGVAPPTKPDPEPESDMDKLLNE